MKLMKMFHALRVALLVSVVATFVACDEETTFIVPKDAPTSAYVVQQGNMYSGIGGSISSLDLESKQVITNVFQAANGIQLGDSPQAATRYGSKAYVPVYGSNLVWIVNGKMQQQARVTIEAPEAVCGAEGYVFVASNNGYLVRMDTLNLQPKADERLEVGPNPSNLVAVGNKVYCSISDGYNYNGGYANGKKVVEIDAKTFTITRTFNVGINPGQLAADPQGNIYVVARGNYADVKPLVQRISASDGQVTDICQGSLIAMRQSVLYVVDLTTDYVNNKVELSTQAYDTLLGKSMEFYFDAEHQPTMPNAIDVNPANGNLFVSCDPSPLGYSDMGTVMEYDAAGHYLHTYAVGVHPCGVIFF